MSKVMHKGLSYHQLHTHFWECGIGIVDQSMSHPALERVVIRTETGDHELAAIHREGDTLIFDLGQPAKETYADRD